MKDYSVLGMNSQSKLGVEYGLLHHCTKQLVSFIMLMHLNNLSKARIHVQVREGFRHLRF